MDSIIINRKTTDNFTIDDIIELNYIIANTNLDLIKDKIKFAKPTTKQETLEFLKAIRPDRNSIEIEGVSIKWKIQPNIKFSKLLKNHFVESLENTSFTIEIKKDMSDDSEIYFQINGKPFKITEEGNIEVVGILKI